MVWVRPLICSRARSGCNSRSMVAALMLSSLARTSAVSGISPNESSTGSMVRSTTTRRLPHMKSNTYQICVRAFSTSWS